MAINLSTPSAGAGEPVSQATLIAPGYPPAIGGVETHVRRLAEGLTRHGVSVSVHAGTQVRSQVGTRDDEGISLTVVGGFSVMSMTLSPRLLIRASRMRDAQRLVHVHSYHSLSGLAVALVGRGPVVFTPHYHGRGHTPLAQLLHVPYDILGRYLFRRADAIVCVSEAERELLLSDFRGLDNKTFVIPNAIDAEPIRLSEPFSVSDPVLLSVGRVEPYKNIDTLIRAFAAIDRPARLVIVGTGSDLPRLRTIAAECDVSERVTFLGKLDQDELNQWLRTAHVVASLSGHEAFGIVGLEGAAAGAHVLLSDIPAHREVAQRYLPSHSTLVDAENSTRVAATLSDLLARPAMQPCTSVPDPQSVGAATLKVYDFARARAGGRTSPRSQRRQARRLSLIDRDWRNLGVAFLAGPVEFPSLDDVRQTYMQFMAAAPTDPLACTLSSSGNHWVPIAETDRQDHARRVLVERTDDRSFDDHHARLREIANDPLPDDLPFRLTVWGNWLYVNSQHALCDGAALAHISLALTLNRLDMLEEIANRVTVSITARSLLKRAPGNVGNWVTFGREMRRRHREFSTRATAHSRVHHISALPRPEFDVVGAVVGPDMYAELECLRSHSFPRVGHAALLSAALFLALRDEGLSMHPYGMQILIDMRKHLDAADGFLGGNGAKCLFIDADMSSPKRIDGEIQRALDTARALPSTLLGAVMPHSQNDDVDVSNHAGPPQNRVLTVSMMNQLMHGDQFADILWNDDDLPQVTGVGIGNEKADIDVFCVRGPNTIDLATAVPTSDPDADSIRRAFKRLHNPAAVLLAHDLHGSGHA